MLMSDRDAAVMADQAIELIAQRVIEALRGDLEAIAAELAGSPGAGDQLTVDQVAHRLRVARSTVYAHWREWGGYKLGSGEKAPIRFDSNTLPTAPPTTGKPRKPPAAGSSRPFKRRRREGRDLLVDAPRFVTPLDQVA